MDPTPVRLEVRVEAPPERPRTTSWFLRLLLVLSVVVGVAQPRSVGLPMLLPSLFVWLAVVFARRFAAPAPTPRGSTIRFLDDAFEVEEEHSIGRTPWEHVTKVYERGTGVGIVLRSSAEVAIPDTDVPGGRAALVAALPAPLAIEPAPPPEARSRTLGLVGVFGLVGILAYGLWSLLHR